jgi:hypothetical protein
MVVPSQLRMLPTCPASRAIPEGNDVTMPRADEGDASRSRDPDPALETGQEGRLSWWGVGGRRVEMFPTPWGWEARVHDPDWGGVTLGLDGLFAGEVEARAWCVKMAAAFVEDAEEEAEGAAEPKYLRIHDEPAPPPEGLNRKSRKNCAVED